MENIQEYIIEDALILIPVLVILGKMLKNMPALPNWLIPFLLLLAGITMALFAVGFHIDGIIQGVLVTGVAVFVHQSFKQLKPKDEQE